MEEAKPFKGHLPGAWQLVFPEDCSRNPGTVITHESHPLPQKKIKKRVEMCEHPFVKGCNVKSIYLQQL